MFLNTRNQLLRSWIALAGTAVLAVAGLHAAPAAAVDTDMTISQTAIDFGAIQVSASSATASVTLTNTGGDPFGPINIFGGAPPTAEFNASQNCQGVTLPAGGSCNVNYTFSPGTTGSFNDTSSFTISETNSQSDGEDFSVSLSGTGTGTSPCRFRICNLDPSLPVLEIPPQEPPAPPAEEPPAPTFSLSLEGTARVTAANVRSRADYVLQLNVDTDALTFSAMDGDGTLYSGHLAPKSPKGTKFSLFLDSASAGAFAADVAARGATLAGQSSPTLLGSDAQIVFKQKADGSASLRIKSTVLVTGMGEVTFNAKLLSR
jgi:Abnormal spindle-like microcephaly-assoc'd, ASPM-SPD-2-Hydin